MNKTTLLKKLDNGEKLLKKEKNYLRKKLRDEADTVFSLWIRKRDERKGCITKQSQGCKNIIQHNCHRIDRSRYSHRRDERNCNGGCASCNTYHSEEHKIRYTKNMIDRYGKERVDEQLFKRNKVKPEIHELRAIIEKYKK